MSREIDDYIAANRSRYTREAITERLTAAGHEPAEIEAAWRRADATPDGGRGDRGWRLGWREFVVLAAMGAIGAALVWSQSSYGGAVIAPIVYLILVSVCMGLGKVLSRAVDGGSRLAVAVGLLVLAAAGAFLAFQSALPLVAAGVVVLLGAPALGLLLLGEDRRTAGMIGAALPIIAWLGLTATCLSPLVTGGVT